MGRPDKLIARPVGYSPSLFEAGAMRLDRLNVNSYGEPAAGAGSLSHTFR